MRVAANPRVLAGVHASYLVSSGLWPLVHRRSFERVTGPKRSFWLVRLVGGLAALNGAILGLSAARGRRSPEARTLALGSFVAFGLADLHATRKASRVYAADLVVQSALLPAWFRRWNRTPKPPLPGGRRSRLFSRRRKAAPEDALLEARVGADLDHAGQGLDVDVAVEGGVATLHGSVASRAIADELVARAGVVPGVRGVDPHLAVEDEAAESR